MEPSRKLSRCAAAAAAAAAAPAAAAAAAAPAAAAAAAATLPQQNLFIKKETSSQYYKITAPTPKSHQPSSQLSAYIDPLRWLSKKALTDRAFSEVGAALRLGGREELQMRKCIL